jgi:hypothetical protein
MAHNRRNGRFLWRSKKANHGRMGALGAEKSSFNRQYSRKRGRRLREA